MPLRSFSILALYFAVAATSTAAFSEKPVWEVRSFMDDSTTPCERSGVELVMRDVDGDEIGRHEIEFAVGVRDQVWAVSPKPQDLLIELYRVDCGGIRSRLAQLSTQLADVDTSKKIYVAVAPDSTALDPQFIEIDTYSDASSMLSVRRDANSYYIRNLGTETVTLCAEKDIQLVSDQRLIDGQWESQELSRDATALPPGVDTRFRLTRLVFPLHPASVEVAAAKVRIAVPPKTASRVKFGEIPVSFHGFPGCDFWEVSRPLTPAEQKNDSGAQP